MKVLGACFWFRFLAYSKKDNFLKNAENSDMLCKKGDFYGGN